MTTPARKGLVERLGEAVSAVVDESLDIAVEEIGQVVGAAKVAGAKIALRSSVEPINKAMVATIAAARKVGLKDDEIRAAWERALKAGRR